MKRYSRADPAQLPKLLPPDNAGWVRCNHILQACCHWNALLLQHGPCVFVCDEMKVNVCRPMKEERLKKVHYFETVF